MNEVEWNVCTDPDLMLDFLHERASSRKWRLLACGCCRLVQAGLRLPALEVAERLADGVASQTEVEAAETEAWAAGRDSWAARMVWEAVLDACSESAAWATWALWTASQPDAPIQAANLLRDLFGPLPFRPPAIDPACLTPSVLTLAERAYGDRLPDGTLDPALLAELGDALRDAGCKNAELLGHLRGPGPHVLGCFAVDAVLGRG